ncbi:MAG: 3'(2'),5'-bisphosphate nucleotidase CysQ [Xanthobacteraceae bacterium]|nr:MAG: 3'(2'),5'-bisphosphate nucleotidase CysQ [Xanthobacteraceae bacterium]
MPGADLPASDADGALLGEAVRAAGKLALSLFRTELRQWTKGVSSPVSEADLAVDELLRTMLRTPRPGYGWLSEESPDHPERLRLARVWVVDPIDGTRAFLAGRDDWSVSVALVQDGRPLVAAVYAPATGEFFSATKGTGARLNDAPIRATQGDELRQARVAGPQKMLEWLNDSELAMVAAPRIGSLALRLARVAEGRLDVALVGGNSHDWDLAAADLLVHEAGGRMTTLAGEGLVYNRPEIVHQRLVAAGGDRHARLVGHIRRTDRT